MAKLFYLTLRGVPLSFDLKFPFHPSSAGADWFVLHGRVTLEEASGLYAEVAVQMSQAVKNMLPSVDERDALSPALNAIRKFTDTRDIEFLRSSKRQPIQLNSRMYSLLTRQWTFHKATDEQLFDFTKYKLYWNRRFGSERVVVADPIDAQYTGASADRLSEAARKAALQGLARIEGDHAVATDGLMARAERVEGETRHALEEINAKHAFERETQKV